MEKKNFQEPTEPFSVPTPDIRNPDLFEEWLNQYITPETYDRSYDDKKHPDGTPLSLEERVTETRQQYRIAAREMIELDELKQGGNRAEKTAEAIRQAIQDRLMGK